MRALTKKEMLMASAVAHLALADLLEQQGRDSITTEQLRERAHSELQYLEGSDAE